MRREDMEKSISRDKSSPTEPQGADFSPVLLVDIELSRRIEDLPVQPSLDGQPYRRARLLVRLHEQPVGVVDIDLGETGIPARQVADHIWDHLSDAIIQHLVVDGCPPPTQIDLLGVPCGSNPRCLKELDAFLENAPFASVVIATHNRTSSLAETLSSLLEMVYPNFEIIVVDNAPSTNETADFMHLTYPNIDAIKYIREDFPGLSIAHNRGLKEVTAPYVAFTDDDVVVDRYWLANLIKGFTTSDRVGCVTGMIYPYELETPAQVWIEQYGGFSKGFQPKIFDLDDHRVDHPLYPFAAGWFGSGASMAFHTETLRGQHGFDPATGAGTLALGGDDLAAFFQIVASGKRLVYEPRAVLFHKHRRDFSGLQNTAYGYGVGLTAYLTKTILDRPARFISLASRIPAGLVYLLGSNSRKNEKKQGDYPKELNRLELKGMLYGPIAYLRSRRRARGYGQYRFSRTLSDSQLSTVRSGQTGD
jgi:O-antigen biosynthesis protein